MTSLGASLDAESQLRSDLASNSQVTDTAMDWELFLLRLRHREGRARAAEAHDPVALDDPRNVWIVYAGYVEVFAVPTDNGQTVGPRHHLFRAAAGDALLGVEIEGVQVGLLASALAGTRLVRLTRRSLLQLAESPELSVLIYDLIEKWVQRLSGALGRKLPPRDCVALAAGEEHALPREAATRAPGGVVWVSHTAGTSSYLGRSELSVSESDAPVPLTSSTWLEARDPARLAATSTSALVQAGTLWASVDRFHMLAVTVLAIDARLRVDEERAQLAESAHVGQARLSGAYARLTSALQPRATGALDLDRRQPLVAACQLIGSVLGVPIKVPPVALQALARNDAVQEIARASRLRIRAVALRGAWWRGSHGPLLGYLMEERRAVALLPLRGGAYELHDPVSGTRQPINQSVSRRLRPLAYAFYRRLDGASLTAWDVIRFGLHGARGDFLRMLLAGLAGGLLGMAIPVATGALLEVVIPSGQSSLLLQFGAGLLVAAVATALFALTGAIAVLRLAGSFGAAEAALLDRVLDLPLPFFRDYSAGDLANRVLGLQVVRETLTSASTSALLAALFSVSAVVVLFACDARLALVACGLVLVLAAALAIAGIAQVRYQRTLGRLGGRLAGASLQLVNGIAKLRVAGGEERAFVTWADRFADQRRVAYQAREVDAQLATFGAAYPVVASLVLFGIVALRLHAAPSIGAFVTLYAAFGQLVGALLALIDVLPGLSRLVAAYERAGPVLRAPLEVRAGQSDPGELSGDIAIDRVSFRYTIGGPLVLNDVSLRIQPGEFVALVGPSGSGKSTLLRLLFGFEAPESGGIFYDGRDLATLDVRAVRRQIGSVLQTGALTTGDIFSNIVGASMLSHDDAWEAVRSAQLAEDIGAMPMGMHTAIGEGGSMLSGGQRQRLLIARAVVRRPRIIFFDEATSALDNRTQELVSKSLEALAATRVVIAHRLSTIINADRIYVLKDARIVESGTYRELMQRRGEFADLVRRQIV